jgi:tripartite-type tricarboxylate transporter receptor subunit TctC
MPHAIRSALAGAMLGLLLSGPAGAQESFPTRPMRLVVPYPAGGGFDFYCRAIGQRMGQALRQPMVIDNRPGAATQLAAEHVAHSRPDGYTQLCAGATMVTTAPHLQERLPYRREDFAPVSLVLEQPMALYVNPRQLPQIQTLRQLVDLAKAKPGELFYATTGRGITTHLIGEMLGMTAGIQMTPVHFRGSDAARTDVIGGRVPLFVDGIPANLPFVASGELRGLAVTTHDQIAALPGVPSFGQAGYPAAELSSWLGIMVPAGTPRPIVARLHEAVVEAMRDPELRARSNAEGAVPVVSTPEQFAARIESDFESWGNLIRSVGLRLE